MTNFTDTFNCNYPIAAMAMNKVSDLKLAVAVRKAGAFPSLSIYNYFISPTKISEKLLQQDLESYKEQCGDSCILLSIGVTQLLNDRLFDAVYNSKVSAIELILETVDESKSEDELRVDERNKRISLLRNNGTLVFVKTINLDDIIDGIDGITLKGPNGAGRGNTQGISLSELFDQVKANYPDLKVIVAGGIGTSAQVKEYMDRGAWACGIGTLFAATEESRVNHETKLKMVEATSQDIQQLAVSTVETMAQNALVFSATANDNFNNTRGLMAGVQSPKSGHIFAGHSVDLITSIVPVQTVVDSLAKDL